MELTEDVSYLRHFVRASYTVAAVGIHYWILSTISIAAARFFARRRFFLDVRRSVEDLGLSYIRLSGDDAIVRAPTYKILQ